MWCSYSASALPGRSMRLRFRKADFKEAVAEIRLQRETARGDFLSVELVRRPDWCDFCRPVTGSADWRGASPWGLSWPVDLPWQCNPTWLSLLHGIWKTWFASATAEHDADGQPWSWPRLPSQQLCWW